MIICFVSTLKKWHISSCNELGVYIKVLECNLLELEIEHIIAFFLGFTSK